MDFNAQWITYYESHVLSFIFYCCPCVFNMVSEWVIAGPTPIWAIVAST